MFLFLEYIYDYACDDDKHAHDKEKKKTNRKEKQTNSIFEKENV
jgi:hypothetical protein